LNNIISVIIPTYNRSKELKRCLESLTRQTYKKFEVIVCDDGSTDNTKEVVNSYRNVLNIIYIKDENFGGPARPRNNGIKLSNGEYIAFLDSDDWWCERKLEISLACLKKGHDIIFHDMFLVNYLNFSKNYKILSFSVPKSKILYQLLTEGNILINSSVIVRKKIIDKVGFFDENKEIIASEDYDYWIRVFLVSNNFFKIKKTLGFYWNGGANISHKKNLSIAGNIILNKYKNIIPNKIFIKSKGYLMYIEGLFFFNNKKKYKSISYFLNSFKYGILKIKLKSIFRILQSII